MNKCRHELRQNISMLNYIITARPDSRLSGFRYDISILLPSYLLLKIEICTVFMKHMYVLVVYSINIIFIDNKIINIKVSQIWINTARLYSNKLSHSWECLPSFCTLLFIKSTSSSDSVSVSPTWWWRDVGLTSSNCDCKASI